MDSVPRRNEERNGRNTFALSPSSLSTLPPSNVASESKASSTKTKSISSASPSPTSAESRESSMTRPVSIIMPSGNPPSAAPAITRLKTLVRKTPIRASTSPTRPLALESILVCHGREQLLRQRSQAAITAVSTATAAPQHPSPSQMLLGQRQLQEPAATARSASAPPHFPPPSLKTKQRQQPQNLSSPVTVYGASHRELRRGSSDSLSFLLGRKPEWFDGIAFYPHQHGGLVYRRGSGGFRGHFYDDNPTTTLWSWDRDKGGATAHPCTGDVPPATYAATGVVIADAFYVFGGEQRGYRSNSLYVLQLPGPHKQQEDTLSSLRWSRVTASRGCPPRGRWLHLSWRWSHLLIVFGGVGAGNEYLNDLNSFDIKAKEWREITTKGQPPPPRAGSCCAVSPFGDVFVFGGYDGKNCTNQLHRLSKATLTWNLIQTSTLSSAIPPPLYRATLDMIGPETLLLIGGLKNDFTTSSMIYSFDLSTKRWSLTLDFPIDQFRDEGEDRAKSVNEKEEDEEAADGWRQTDAEAAEDEEEDEETITRLPRGVGGGVRCGDNCGRVDGARIRRSEDGAAAAEDADADVAEAASRGAAGVCYHATASASGIRKLFVVGGESKLNRAMNPCLIEIDVAHFD